DTGEREEIECGLVLRSIGYRGIGLEGLPFDDSGGVIPNENGRVVDPETGKQIPGQYAVGWIKRGPSGVIGTNKKDALDTVKSLIEDLEADRMPEPGGDTSAEAIAELVSDRVPDFVSFGGWQAIDRAEVVRGEPLGRPRVKFATVKEMVEAARDADGPQ
ncbi:MAG: NADP oxidoreductase, partial [Solirubrobacterales bacterium]